MKKKCFLIDNIWLQYVASKLKKKKITCQTTLAVPRKVILQQLRPIAHTNEISIVYLIHDHM